MASAPLSKTRPTAVAHEISRSSLTTSSSPAASAIAGIRVAGRCAPQVSPVASLVLAHHRDMRKVGPSRPLSRILHLRRCDRGRVLARMRRGIRGVDPKAAGGRPYSSDCEDRRTWTGAGPACSTAAPPWRCWSHGDELPERLRTQEGRHAAFRDAKLALDASARRAGDGAQDPDPEEPLVKLDLDRERLVNSERGRRGWLREGRRQLHELGREQTRPIARSPGERLHESTRRLQKSTGARSSPTPPMRPTGRRRGTGEDGGSAGRPTRTRRRSCWRRRSTPITTRGSCGTAIQGYNAEAAVNGDKIIIAAEVTIDSPDCGHLEPTVNEAVSELHKVGVTELLRRRGGRWLLVQATDGEDRRRETHPGADSSRLRAAQRQRPTNRMGQRTVCVHAPLLEIEHGKAIDRKRAATIEPVFGQTKLNPKSTASSDEEDLPHAENGDSRRPPTAC